MSRIGRGCHQLVLMTIVMVGVSVPVSVAAQEYPSKTIRWIVPYPPGGTSDFLARLIGQKLSDSWKQVVVIDNRGGANGNIGTEMAAKAPADGYTLLLVANAITINQSLYPNLTFD